MTASTSAERLRAFDPNAPDNTPWATWSPHGGFKTHANRGGALTRYGATGLAAIYEKGEDGLWHERFRKSPEDEQPICTVCGQSTILDEPTLRAKYPRVFYRYWQVRPRPAGTNAQGILLLDAGAHLFVRRNGKLKHPLTQHYACAECYSLI